MAAADELLLLERVFLRLGSADTDEQLESTLSKFLPPVLLKLSSSHEAVRKKVMELLIHVNKRVKSRGKVQLPVDVLLLQYQDPEASTFLTNFSILYIKLGFPRLNLDKQISLMPALVNSLDSKPRSQQETILQLLKPIWGNIKDLSLVNLSEKPKTKQLLLEFMMDVLLLPYGVYVPQPDSASSGGGTSTPPITVPPGFNEITLKRVTGDTPMSAEELERCKQGVIHFLSTDVVPEQEGVCHLIVAFADSRHSVATAADYQLKKITSTIDWENEKTMKMLYLLFMGTPKVKEKSMKPENIRSGVSTRVRLKLFPYLLRSKMAATMFPLSVQVIFEGLFGKTTNQKLKMLAVQFVHHVCLYCPREKLAPVAQVLMNGMHDLIKNNPADGKMKISAYTAVGKLGHTVPSLVVKDISLVQKLFDALTQETTDARLGVQEALAMLCGSYKLVSPSDRLVLETLLMQNIDKEDSLVRSLTVSYTATVFSPDHIPSRFILLLAAGDSKEDIHTEARKALLSPLTRTDTNSDDIADLPPTVPDFVAMVNYISQQAATRMQSTKKCVIGNHTLPFTPPVYSQIVWYLRVCLAYRAGVCVDMGTDLEHSPPLTSLPQLLTDKSSDESKAVEIYLTFVHKLLKATEDVTALYCVLELVAVCPHVLAQQFIDDLPWFKKLVVCAKEERRLYSSQLYSLILTHTSSQNDVVACVQDFTTQFPTKDIDKQHGLMLTMGFILGHLLHNMKTTDISDEIKPVVVDAIANMAKSLMGSTDTLKMGACVALGEVGRNGSLMLPVGSKDDEFPLQLTLYSLASILLSMIKSIDFTDKVKEKAALCLGYMCTGDESFPHKRYIIQGIIDSVQAKQIELQFTMGEAMVCAAEGVNSPVTRNAWVQTEAEYRASCVPGEREDDVEWYLKHLLSTYVSNENPHLRQASCIWLLTLVKSCGHHSAIQSSLILIQSAFMRLLTEKEELIQDMASKGLGIVYEQCSQEQKSTLVSQLVDTLTTGKRATQQVTSDTEMFQEGALGKAPDGSSLSTYKELCSIASDLNQPDLIYKFMHLANHQAMWNSRKGAAFGFSTIVAQAGEQMAPFLPKIVPKLYRYQFDPNPKVQRAMSSIWNALVKDNKKTVELYKREILADLIKNLTNPEWRVRESSCYAVSDILGGRQLDDAIELLPELWTTCLRVRDDIKESVRKAADVACKTLSKISIRVCNVEAGGKEGQRATSLVLPCLLSATIESQVKEVRAIGLSTLLEISKKAGALLKPHIALLVTALLEAVSGLEPQILNYLSLHVGSSDDTQQQLDNVRIAASKSSPMLETVNRCVQYVDSNVLEDLVPRLCDLIKSGIGVSTKVGCCNFVISLVRHCGNDLSSHSGKLITALMNGLHDRNASIRKANASAIGHIVRVSKDARVEKLILKLQSWYMEKDDDIAKQACCVTLWSISHHSPDIIKRHATLVLPLTFFAMHETTEDGVSKQGLSGEMSLWEEVWSESTPGMEAGLKLYLGEIMTILSGALESQSWVTKAQAAASMQTLATKLTSLSNPYLSNLISALLSALTGRTWTGKESLLKALSSVCVSCRSTIENNDPSTNQPTISLIIEAILKECRKDKTQYKKVALSCLGNVLEAYSVDYFSQLWEILSPYLLKSSTDKHNDSDNDDDVGNVTERRANIEEYDVCVYRVLGQAWPNALSTQEKYATQFCDVLTTSLSSASWKVQLVILKTLHTFITRSVTLSDEKNCESSQHIVGSIVDSVISCLGNLKYSSIRSESLVVMETLIKAISPNTTLHSLQCWTSLRTQLSVILANDRSEQYDKAKTVLALLDGM